MAHVLRYMVESPWWKERAPGLLLGSFVGLFVYGTSLPAVKENIRGWSFRPLQPQMLMNKNIFDVNAAKWIEADDIGRRGHNRAEFVKDYLVPLSQNNTDDAVLRIMREYQRPTTRPEPRRWPKNLTYHDNPPVHWIPVDDLPEHQQPSPYLYVNPRAGWGSHH